jgi:GNAT superfamily N-acetyltransferase
MTFMSIVRIARPEDHGEIWRLFLQAHHENGLFPYAADKVEWIIQRAIAPWLIPAWDAGVRPVIGVIGDVGALEAILLISPGEFWYTREKHLEEYLVYVDPECRRTFHARALIKWMKEQSNRAAVPLLTGVISTVKTKTKCELYGRMIPKVGEFFLHVPHSVQSSSAAIVAA